MKKYFYSCILITFLLFSACKSGDKKHDGHGTTGDAPQTLTDSLLKDIDDGHIVGMSKIGKLHIAQKEVQRLIDSIGQLPAAAKEKAGAYLAGLEKAVKDIQYADFAMDKWMMEYDEDSAKENADQRLVYLKAEKEKVDKMKAAILGSLQQADSLLKIKP
jgi:hypothetical protein